MEQGKHRAKRYCAAAKCRSNDKLHRNWSFFRFPKDPERCKEWIKNCDRDDLLNKTSDYCYNNLYICAWHFEESMFLNFLKNRLKPLAVPTVFNWSKEAYSQEIWKSDKEADKPIPSTSYISEKEEEPAISLISLNSDVQTQTPPSFINHSPRNEKLRAKLKCTRKQLTSLRRMVGKDKNLSHENKVNMLCQLCDDLLEPKLANFIKLQVKLSLKPKKKVKYSQECKQFCLQLYFTDPSAYESLSQTLSLPCPRTLKRMIEAWDTSPGFSNLVFGILKT